MEYTLSEIEPAASTVMLDKEYKLRVFNVNDAVFFEQKYGSGYYLKKLKESPTSILTEIAYMLINYDEDGNKLELFKSIQDFRKMLNIRMLNKSNLLDKTMEAYGFCFKSVETPKKK